MLPDMQKLSLGPVYPDPYTYGTLECYLEDTQYDTDVTPRQLHIQVCTGALKFLKPRSDTGIDERINARILTFMNKTFGGNPEVENYIARCIVSTSIV